MLSAPGLRFHRVLAPFLQLVVGSAHSAVCGVLGYTSFLLWFSLSSCVDFYFYYFCCIARCPCLPSVPRVGFSAGVTQDVASDSVPFLGFRTPRHVRTCLLPNP